MQTNREFALTEIAELVALIARLEARKPSMARDDALQTARMRLAEERQALRTLASLGY